MTKQEVLKIIADGSDPVTLGKLAHRITDWVIISGTIFVETPRFGWHRATDREAKTLLGNVRKPKSTDVVTQFKERKQVQLELNIGDTKLC